MKIVLEQRGSTNGVEHNKGYVIEENGNQVIFRWGSLGAKFAEKVGIESNVAAIRQECIDKQIKSKVKKGYVIVEQNGRKLEQRPSSEGRKFGVEIETHSNLPIGVIASKMRERNLPVKEVLSYKKTVGSNWEIKTDSSCGFEFASPILSGDAGLFDAKIAVEKIREVCESAVNNSCGLHVTVDTSDHTNEDIHRLVVAYLKYQKFFYKECGDHRQNNRYCQKNPTNALERIKTITSVQEAVRLAGGTDRYYGFNLTKVFSHKCVEFRMMESSVVIRAVGAWVRTCVGFVSGVKNLSLSFDSKIDEKTFQSIINTGW